MNQPNLTALKKASVAGLIGLTAVAMSACVPSEKKAGEATTTAVQTPSSPESSGSPESSATETSSSAETSASSDASASTETSSSASAETSASSGDPNFKATPPGTKLKVGEEAKIVMKKSSGASGNLVLTVIKVTKGDLKDFGAMKGVEKYQGHTPYYVQAKFSAADAGSEAALSYASVNTYLRLGTTSGDGINTLLVIGSFPKCKNASFKKEPKPGEVIETCLIGMAKPGQKGVGLVAWAQSGTPYSTVNGKPILWQVP